MLLPRLTNCPECASIPGLLRSIDCKLNEVAKNLYNNTIFSLNQPISGTVVLDLLNYKRILTYRICNQNYAGHYSLNMIASRVIRLTVGCTPGCDPNCETVTYTSTTTTTTLAPCYLHGGVECAAMP